MGLGDPPKELCEVEDAARAVIQSLALVKQVTSFSGQNLALRKYEWEPSSREESLVAAPDISVPAWVERQVGLDPDYWQYVPTCNLAVLEESRLTGAPRCAFFTEDGQLMIRFSYDPSTLSYPTHRLWFDPNVFIVEMFDDLALDSQTTAVPGNFWPLISGFAEQILISTMRIRAAMNKENPASKDLISAWDKREAFLVRTVGLLPTWADRLQHFAYGSRGARRGRRRRPILAGRAF